MRVTFNINLLIISWPLVYNNSGPKLKYYWIVLSPQILKII